MEKIVADFHIHSSKSFDSIMLLETIEAKAKSHGINVIAIADHNVFHLHPSKKKLLIVPAIEMSTDKGHVLGLFLTQAPESKKDFNEAIAEIHRCGGLAGIAHPYQRTENVPEEVFQKVDFIEVYNSRNSNYKVKNSNELAKAKAAELDKPFTAGSDAHFTGEVGLVKMTMDAEEFTLDAVKKAILEKKGEIIGKKSKLTNKAKSAIVKDVKAKEWWRLPKTIAFYIYALWTDFNDWTDSTRKKK